MDVGSGLSDVVANLLERGADAYGVDPVYRNLSGFKDVSEKYLAYIKRSYGGEYEAMRVHVNNKFWDSFTSNPEHYLAAYATKLPFKDRSFDIVYSNSVILPYLATDWNTLVAAINECIRVIKQGGTISLSPYEGHAQPENDLETIRHLNERKLIAWLQGNHQVTSEIKKIPVGNWSGHRALFIHKRRK